MTDEEKRVFYLYERLGRSSKRLRDLRGFKQDGMEIDIVIAAEKHILARLAKDVLEIDDIEPLDPSQIGEAA